MSYLVAEPIAYHAPDSITGTRRALLVALGMRCSDVETRRVSVSHAVLGVMVGLSERRVRKLLGELADLGFDVRVPDGTGKDGRPLYAVPGTVPTFALPVFPAPPDCTCPHCKGAAGGRLDGPQGGRNRPTRRPKPVPKAAADGRPNGFNGLQTARAHTRARASRDYEDRRRQSGYDC